MNQRILKLHASRSSIQKSDSISSDKLLLVNLLQEAKLSATALQNRHWAAANLLKRLTGQVPNSTRYLEVWPPAFESHNLLFFSVLVVRGARARVARALMLAAHLTTRFEEHAYLEANVVVACCYLGLPAEKMVANAQIAMQFLSNGGGDSGENGSNTNGGDAVVDINVKPELFTEEEWLAITVARELAKPKPTLTAEQKKTLVQHFGPLHAEYVAASSSLMGYLGKFTDAIAVELEEQIAELAEAVVGGSGGWSPKQHAWATLASSNTSSDDNKNNNNKHSNKHNSDKSSGKAEPPKPRGLAFRLSLLPMTPFVFLYARGLRRGVPTAWKQLAPLLNLRVGHSFPFLQYVVSDRLRRATATVILKNWDADTSVSGLYVKSLLLGAYSALMESECLATAAQDMAKNIGTSETDLQKATAFATGDEIVCDCFENLQVCAMLTLGKTLLSTPCRVVPRVVEFLKDVDVAPSVIVELTMWIALLQMLHRLSWYALL